MGGGLGRSRQQPTVSQAAAICVGDHRDVPARGQEGGWAGRRTSGGGEHLREGNAVVAVVVVMVGWLGRGRAVAGSAHPSRVPSAGPAAG